MIQELGMNPEQGTSKNGGLAFIISYSFLHSSCIEDKRSPKMQ